MAESLRACLVVVLLCSQEPGPRPARGRAWLQKWCVEGASAPQAIRELRGEPGQAHAAAHFLSRLWHCLLLLPVQPVLLELYVALCALKPPGCGVAVVGTVVWQQACIAWYRASLPHASRGLLPHGTGPACRMHPGASCRGGKLLLHSMRCDPALRRCCCLHHTQTYYLCTLITHYLPVLYGAQ